MEVDAVARLDGGDQRSLRYRISDCHVHFSHDASDWRRELEAGLIALEHYQRGLGLDDIARPHHQLGDLDVVEVADVGHLNFNQIRHQGFYSSKLRMSESTPAR